MGRSWWSAWSGCGSITPGDTWKGGVCIQVGCALAAMEMVVYLSKRWSMHVARPVGYAVFALYGLLSWSHNTVSAYLSSIGAVPHDRTLGRALVWMAIGLSALEGRARWSCRRAQSDRPPPRSSALPLSPGLSWLPTGG